MVSNAADGSVNCYNAAGNQTAHLTGFNIPKGVASDRAGNLYVVDYKGQESRLIVYSGGCGGTPKSYIDPNAHPGGVAVDANGNVAVINGGADDRGRSGSVTFFDSTGRLTKTVRASHGYLAYGAFDRAGNLFVDGVNSPKSSEAIFGEIVGGAAGHSIDFLKVRNHFNYIGGIQVGADGNISVMDLAHKIVFRYAPPKNGSLGAPLSSTRLNGILAPEAFAFANDNNAMWVSDVESSATCAMKYSFPKGGDPLRVTHESSSSCGSSGVTVIRVAH